MEEDEGILIRGLIEDVIQNFNKHREIVDELCIAPIHKYVSTRLTRCTQIFYITGMALLLTNIIVLVVIYDTRKLIKKIKI